MVKKGDLVKSLKVFLALTMVVSSAFAAIQPRSLGDAMKIMNDKLKSIAAQTANAGMNPQSAILADEFVEAAAAAKAFVPEAVTHLPVAEQAAKTTRYNQLIDITVDQGKRLAAAFRADDNAGALKLLKEMKDNARTGHGEFKHD